MGTDVYTQMNKKTVLYISHSFSKGRTIARRFEKSPLNGEMGINTVTRTQNQELHSIQQEIQ